MDLLTRILSRARGKALADLHPELQDRVHLATLRSDEVLALGASYSYLDALGDYESHVWVRKAVKTIADNLGVLPLTIHRAGKWVNEHDLMALLSQPNPSMSSSDLWQQWVVDMLIGGEEGWELVRDGERSVKEIWPRQPHTIQVVPDAALRRYFKVLHYTIDDGVAKPFDVPADEFVLFKFYNPSNPWRGLSPVAAVRSAILIDTFAQSWSVLFFKKSARPDYAVITPAGITPSEREDIEKKLAFKFGGVANSFKPIVLEEGVTDVKVLSFPPKDIEWIEQRKLTREEIGAIFGVPDEIMGWGRDTYENFDTAHWVFWALTILPLAGFRDIHLTEFFRRSALLRPDESIVSDTSQIAALKRDLKSKAEIFDILARWGYPINAINAYLGLGLPDVRGGDVGYLPLSFVPVTRLDAGGKAQEAGSRTQDTGHRTQGIGYKALDAGGSGIEYGSAEHAQKWQLFVKRVDPWERKFGDAVADLFEAQRAEVLRRIKGGVRELTRITRIGGNGHEAQEYTKDVQDVADNPFDREKWQKKFKKKVKPLYREIVGAAGQNALDDIAVSIAFDILDERVVEFLTSREQRFAEEVNETTWSRLKESLTEGLRDGEGIPDLAARVEEEMQERIRSSGEVIARTEVIGASNGGTLLGWEQSEVVEGKAWLAALDDRTRETHVEAHRRYNAAPIPTGRDFQVGAGRGPSPGQIGLPEEDIQCRCTMTAILK